VGAIFQPLSLKFETKRLPWELHVALCMGLIPHRA
jgi:hypothetical protein